MSPNLRVDPMVVRSAGSTMAQLGADLSGMGVGQPLSRLPGSLRGFQSGSAGTKLGTQLDAVCKRLGDNFSQLGESLRAAADKYEQTDAGQGKKINDAFETSFDAKEGSDENGDGPKPGVGAPAQPIPMGQVTYNQGNYPSGPQAARNAINQALDQLGITDPVARQRWMDGYMTLILRESSYNPAAVNNWDVNSRPPNSTYKVSDGYGNGASRGLAQCVPGTFARYHQPGTSDNIYDPVANVAASMNYVMGVYGVARDGSNLAAKIPQANSNVAGHGY